MHMEWTIKAAKAGKHILCEKPIAMNLREAQAMIDAARENNVALMEAFMYRCHPLTHKVLEIIRSGMLGEIRMIQASYGFSTQFDPADRLFDKALGGSGLLDVGLYPISYARLIAGVANGQDFADPIDLQAVAHLGETGVDEWSAAVLRFPGDIVAQLATSLVVHLENNLRILGSRGQLLTHYPFHPSWWGGGQHKITITRGFFCPVQEITVKDDRSLFAHATETFARHVLQGDKQVAAPGMRWDDTLGNMRTLDRWRKCIGLSYDCDAA
jgi:predicted dehydrogenase